MYSGGRIRYCEIISQSKLCRRWTSNQSRPVWGSLCRMMTSTLWMMSGVSIWKVLSSCITVDTNGDCNWWVSWWPHPDLLCSSLHEVCFEFGRCVSTLGRIDRWQRLTQIQRLPGNNYTGPVQWSSTALMAFKYVDQVCASPQISSLSGLRVSSLKPVFPVSTIKQQLKARKHHSGFKITKVPKVPYYSHI